MNVPLPTAGWSFFHPPLYYWLLAAWVRLAGNSVVVLRALSALTGTLTMSEISVEPTGLAAVAFILMMVGAIGKDVHNLGVEGFADWMQDLKLGYISVKLGPAVPIAEVVNKIREARPEAVAISMRLGDLHVDKLISEFVETATKYGLHPKDSGIRFTYGGLRPAANLVRSMTNVPVEPDQFTPPEERRASKDAARHDSAESNKLRKLERQLKNILVQIQTVQENY